MTFTISMMTFTISMMTQIWLLVAVFMLVPVIGRVVDKRQEVSTPPDESIDNDIALIRVNGSGIQFNDYVQPVCLPVDGDNKEAGRWMRIAGWGYQTLGELKTLLVRVMNETHCASFFPPGRITSHELCVRQKDGKGDVCSGDYGGPVTFQTGEIHILGGINTQSISRCQVSNDGVVLANVLSHKMWIDDSINRNSNANERVIPSRTD